MKHIYFFSVLFLFLASCGSEDKKPAEQQTTARSALKVKEIIGVGKVEPQSKVVELAATSAGIVQRVFRGDGDIVKAGEKLVQLENEVEGLQASEVRSELITQQGQIAVERSNIDDAKAKLTNKLKLLATTRNLLDNGAETQQAYDDLQTDVQSLQATLSRSKSNLTVAQNKVNEISSRLRTANVSASRKTLIAPSDGQILNIKVTEGASLNQYATYAEFAPKGELLVRAEVDELYSQQLKTGQAVNFRYAGSPEVIAKGTVTFLSPYLKRKSLFSEKANDQEDRRVREIRISINGQAPLVINAKVECAIQL